VATADRGVNDRLVVLTRAVNESTVQLVMIAMDDAMDVAAAIGSDVVVAVVVEEARRVVAPLASSRTSIAIHRS
jgi:hypothetical protein